MAGYTDYTDPDYLDYTTLPNQSNTYLTPDSWGTLPASTNFADYGSALSPDTMTPVSQEAQSGTQTGMLADQEFGLDTTNWGGSIYNNANDMGLPSQPVQPTNWWGEASEALSTGFGMVNKMFTSLLGFGSKDPANPTAPAKPGESDAMSKIYASAIAAGVAGIASYLGNQDTIAASSKLKAQEMAHEDKMISDKYRREDESRQRQGTVASGTRGQVAYKPYFNAGYKTPGTANAKQYGLLGGVR